MTKKTIFLISGQKQNGKGVLAKAIELASNQRIADVAFSHPLKEIAVLLLNMPREVAYGGEEIRLAWKHPSALHKRDLNAREWLQWIGAQLGREMVADDLWIERVKERLEGTSVHYAPIVLDLICITDARYANEIFELQSRLSNEFNVVTIRIRRPGFVNTDSHSSEAEQLTLKDDAFDEVIINDGGIEKLRMAAEELVRKYVAR